MALKPEEQKLLDDLIRRSQEDDDQDYEVEIFSGDKGARIPMAKAAAWLHKEFGIGDAPAAPPAGDADGDAKGKDKTGDVAPGIRKLFKAQGA